MSEYECHSTYSLIELGRERRNTPPPLLTSDHNSFAFDSLPQRGCNLVILQYQCTVDLYYHRRLSFFLGSTNRFGFSASSRVFNSQEWLRLNQWVSDGTTVYMGTMQDEKRAVVVLAKNL